MILYALYRLGRFLALALPLRFSYAVAAVCADAVYACSAADRAAVVGNLRMVLGRDTDEREVKRLARQVFRNFAKYLVDFFRFSLVDREFVRRFVTVTHPERIAQAAARGKGVICISAHIGNWELGGAVLSQLGYPLTGVALTHDHEKVNAFFRNQRLSAGVRAIEIGASLKAAYRLLKSNGFLGLIGDRDFTGNGIPTDFFGKPASIPRGPAAFACRIGSPILPVFLIRDADDRYTLHIGEPIESPRGMAEDAAMIETTKQCVAAIETCIRRHPEQWFAFRNVWAEHAR